MRSKQATAVLAILVCSIVLRPPLAAMGPLLPEISNSLQLSSLNQAILSAVPVLAFGLGAFVGPWFSAKLGSERAMVILLAVLAAAIALRGWFGFGSLVVLSLIHI